MNVIKVHFHERLVSSLATDTRNTATNTDATKQMEREIHKGRVRRVVFIVTYIAGGGLLLLTATHGTLVSTNIWLSVIWFIPVLLLLTPFLYAVVSYATVAQMLKRFVPAVIAAGVLFVSLLLIIFSGYTDDLFALIVGNETMGLRGLTGTLTWLAIGMFLSFALAFVLPVALFATLVRTLIQVDISVRKVILWAVCTPLGFILSIGMSIIRNSGF